MIVKSAIDDLTPGMRKALGQVMFGVVSHPDGGWCLEEDSTEVVDGRSIRGLGARGLVTWEPGLHFSLLRGEIILTEAGVELLRSLGENP